VDETATPEENLTMKKTTNPTKELCAVCGGELRPTTITHEERRGGHLYLFENVPAKVCTKCGEIWIEEKTLQAIDRLIERGQPTRHVPTPLYDFALTGAK
jgi:YgiT-type zinc finger domain-containing protein